MNGENSEKKIAQEAEGFIANHYAELTDSIVNYYTELTDSMVKYWGSEILACHYGLWGEDTATGPESMLRANRTLIKGLDLRPGKRVLDSGSGVGGTSIWLAETYGVYVTGLNICEANIPVAENYARERGVDHLVDFCLGDFMDMPFADDQFDAVVNHESFAHATDKATYLQGVWRVLKPGGRWQSLDGFLTGAPLSDDQEKALSDMERKFHISPMGSLRELVATLEEAGYEDIRVEDFTAQVLPSTEECRKQWMLYVLLAPPKLQRPYDDFRWGTVTFDGFLRDGIITYNLTSGAKPASKPEHPIASRSSPGNAPGEV